MDPLDMENLSVSELMAEMWQVYCALWLVSSMGGLPPQELIAQLHKLDSLLRQKFGVRQVSEDDSE